LNNRLKELWNTTLSLLESELTEISFNTWIKTISPVNISNNQIYLGVPADFNKGIVESRYVPLIENALRQASNKNYVVNIEINTDNDDTKTNKSTTKTFNSLLNPKYTFEHFVIGNNNRLAHAGSVAVAETPSKAYNPLFIYGGVGLGKTHLMHAIGHYILNVNNNQKVMYVTSEKFTNELINAIKDDKNNQFRKKYREVDVLLIDDIQFIGGKERTQEEFFHTFNSLYEANKQIVITSDRPPKDIITLEDRLKSRFEWGLIADIQSPDIETRTAILRKKAQIDGTIITDDVLDYIAKNISSNIRELEGALNKVIAYSGLIKKNVTMEVTVEALKDAINRNQTKEINTKTIIEVVARYFDQNEIDFFSKKRNRAISYPRQIAMYLSRELTELSLPKIGDAFGGRDHSTVIHAFDKITEKIETSSETRRTIEELKESLMSK
jgi:chromosomal replication initiator protein